jgi:hypothetical protein
MPTAEDPDLRINASPSKEFFIHMLTRDVQLTRAIIDLVDNCIDGAKRLKGAEVSLAFGLVSNCLQTHSALPTIAAEFQWKRLGIMPFASGALQRQRTHLIP